MKLITLQDGRQTRVSDVDYPWLIEHKWRVTEANASKQPYVITTVRVAGRRTSLYMHRAIVRCARQYKVDHEDRDGLNNQRSNLRIASHFQNCANRAGWSETGFKGVSRKGGAFVARITIDGELVQLGRSRDLEELARLYDKAAYEIHGEFAYLNFPDEYPRTIEHEQEIPF